MQLCGYPVPTAWIAYKRGELLACLQNASLLLPWSLPRHCSFRVKLIALSCITSVSVSSWLNTFVFHLLTCRPFINELWTSLFLAPWAGLARNYLVIEMGEGWRWWLTGTGGKAAQGIEWNQWIGYWGTFSSCSGLKSPPLLWRIYLP